MIRLDDKVAIVTGAATGLGAAYALALATVGAAVVVNDVGAEVDGSIRAGLGPGGTVAAIRERGGRAIASTESVTDAAGVERLAAHAVATFGRLDILVNNAGIQRSAAIVDTTEADFNEVVAVHLGGTFLCTRAAMRAMIAAKHGGRIINVVSGRAYYAPSANTASYAAAKGAVLSLTGVTAAEGKPHGILCNAISPLARTRMSERYLAGDEDAELAPETVAPLVVFLASDTATVNGEILRIARGEIARIHSVIEPPLRSRQGRWTAEEIAERIGEICITV